MADTPGDGFDPSAVPPFPVLTLALDEDEETVALDGVPITQASGESLRDAGTAAVARRLEADQLEAVRVRVVTPGEDAWRMVVTADGGVYDTTPTEDGEERKRITRRRLLVGGGALAAFGLAGGAAAVIVPRVLESSKPTPWQVPGVDTQIPVALPPGFATRAAWAVPVARHADVGQLDTGHIVTVADDGTLTVRHPETAQPQWAGASAPDAIRGVRSVRWDASDAIAVTASSTLYVWPLTIGEGGMPTAAVTHRLDTGARAELNGAPFIELRDWFVDLPAANMGTKRITIPAGTRAALREEGGTLHCIDPERVHHLDANGTKAGEHALNLENRPARMPAGVWALSPETVLAAWEGKDTRLTVIRPADGTVLADQTVSERIDQRTPVRPLSSSLFLVGSTIVSHVGNASIRPTDQFKPSAAHGATVYGVIQRAPATMQLKADAEAPRPWDAYRDDDPPPRLVTDAAAFIVAPSLDSTMLYAAPRL